MFRPRRNTCWATRRRRGVTSTEYAVMLALMLGVAMSSINCLGYRTMQTFERTDKAIAGETSGNP